MKMSVPTGGTPSTWPKDRSFRPWSSTVEASSTLAHSDARASGASKGAFSAFSTSSYVGGVCLIDDVRVEESDLDRMEILFILSLEFGVFSQRYQIPWKHKVALWAIEGNWEEDGGGAHLLIVQVSHAPIARGDRHQSCCGRVILRLALLPLLVSLACSQPVNLMGGSLLPKNWS